MIVEFERPEDKLGVIGVQDVAVGDLFSPCEEPEDVFVRIRDGAIQVVDDDDGDEVGCPRVWSDEEMSDGCGFDFSACVLVSGKVTLVFGTCDA